MSEEDNFDRLIEAIDGIEKVMSTMAEIDLMSTLRKGEPTPKSEWPDGPWMTELDEKKWIDKATGLHCWIVRDMHVGNLCGYVGVPRNHPLYGKENRDFKVHGGVTMDGGENAEDGLWYFGFDCMHVFDLLPRIGNIETLLGIEVHPVMKREYRAFDFVESECVSLAKQIGAYNMPNPMEPPSQPTPNPVNPGPGPNPQPTAPPDAPPAA